MCQGKTERALPAGRGEIETGLRPFGPLTGRTQVLTGSLQTLVYVHFRFRVLQERFVLALEGFAQFVHTIWLGLGPRDRKLDDFLSTSANASRGLQDMSTI